MGRVRISEIPSLLDARLLALFFVLTVAVELGKASGLFDRMVAAVVARARSARGLALAMIGTTGVLSAVLTNDVALFLVVPFTMLLRKVTDLDLAPLVVLEVLAANLLCAVTPIGNPQNLFLYARGGFTPGAFLAAQLPLAAASALALAAATVWIVPRKALPAAPSRAFDVEPLSAGAFAVLLGAELASLLGPLPHLVPLALAVPGMLLLGRRLREADLSLVVVFAFLFVGIPASSAATSTGASTRPPSSCIRASAFCSPERSSPRSSRTFRLRSCSLRPQRGSPVFAVSCTESPSAPAEVRWDRSPT